LELVRRVSGLQGTGSVPWLQLSPPGSGQLRSRHVSRVIEIIPVLTL
jgi:hypothetical protein